MKSRKNLVIVISLCAMLLLFTSCQNEIPYIFEVYFANDYTEADDNLDISGLYLKEQDGSWTESLIPSGEYLEPGEFLVFTVNIPKGDYLEFKISVEHDSTTYELTESVGAQLSISSSPLSPRAYSIVVSLVSNEPIVTYEGGFASDPLWDDTQWTNPNDESDIRNYTKVSWSPK